MARDGEGNHEVTFQIGKLGLVATRTLGPLGPAVALILAASRYRPLHNLPCQGQALSDGAGSSGTGPKLAHYFLCARLDMCEPQMSSRPRPLLPLVIAATERRILEQQRRIERRKAEGRSTEASEELLMAMLTSLGIHQYKLNILRRYGETRH